jgi:Putative zinc-finger
MTAVCTYPDDRDETLIAYLYDDIDAPTRATFEAHVSACAACRAELDGLRGVRRQLAEWAEPVDSQQSTVNTVDRHKYPRLSTLDPRPPTLDSRKASWLPDVPAWAQAAAAVLIVGVAAGIANLDIRYDANGLSIRTGWSKPFDSPKGEVAQAKPAADPARTGPVTDTVTRAELVALEQRLRDDVRALQAGAHAVAASDAQPARALADGDLMRRVRAMLDEGEKRQQRELALRVGELLRDVNAQRQADLVRIDRSLGVVENNLGVEVLKQRERVNYLLRVNQRQ